MNTNQKTNVILDKSKKDINFLTIKLHSKLMWNSYLNKKTS